MHFVIFTQLSHAGFSILGTIMLPLQLPTLMGRENEDKKDKKEKPHKVNQEIDNTKLKLELVNL